MRTNAPYNRNDVNEYPVKGPLLYSALFHLAVLIIAAVGLPFVAKDPLIISQPINVEILDVEEISQTNRLAQPQKTEKEKLPEPPQKTEEAPAQMTAEAPPDLITPKPPEPDPEPDVKPEPEEAIPEPVKEKPKDKPEPKKPPPPPKEKPKPPQEKPDDRFSSLLKNLTPDAKPETDKTQENLDPTAKSAPALSQMAQLSDRLSISELDLFKRQLAPCWNVPAGAKYAEELVIEVRVNVNRDRTVQSASIVDQGRYSRDGYFRAAADAALRALRNPKCQPLQLPEDKYDQWKTMSISFDPREML